jgi:double-stranded uracil-DNA glycosylase
MTDHSTLPDIPCRPGGVLLVGINPAPPSVAAGHNYQGRHGRRLWKRLERIGLLRDADVGLEDEAFARAGHGLTDLVKRPTASAAELSAQELADGRRGLQEKIRRWEPGLLLFAYRPPAVASIGREH